MAIYLYSIVFYCFLFFSTRVFLAESSVEVVRLSSDQINLFLENMDTFLSSKCKFSKNQYYGLGLAQLECELHLQKCLFELNVAKMRARLVEIDQQQSPSTMTANEFMDMLLTKMVAELLHIPILHQSEQNVSLDQQLRYLTPEQNLLILLEFFDVANNFGKTFLNKLKRDEKRKSDPFELTYMDLKNKELSWRFGKAAEMIGVVLKKRFEKSGPSYWFDINEHFNIKIAQQTEFKDWFSLSLSQMSLFLINMENFLSSKYQLIKTQLFEKMKWNRELKKCLSKMREIFKQSDGTSLMEIDQHQSPPTMTANAFMEMLLTKMLAELLQIPILHQSEQNVFLDQQLSNLTPEQNLLILLELFDVANNFGETFLNKLKRDEKRQMTDQFVTFHLINFGYYKEMMWKFESAEEFIEASLKNDFKRSATYWFDLKKHFDVTIYSQKSENIFGLKLAVNIETLILIKIIEIIGNFINKSCGKNMWNSVYEEEELKNCSNHINFAELGAIFESEYAKRDDNSFFLANLIVGILKNKALADGADKRLCPYNMDIFAQIDDAESKLSVLKGLLEFGRLFMVNIFAIKLREMLWENVPITFASEERPADEMEAIRESLEKAGLIEAMGDEIVENREKAAVKRKNISD